METKNSKKEKSNSYCSLKTDSCEVVVDTANGMLAEFRFLRNGLNPWEDVLCGEKIYTRTGGIRITDELTDTTYKDNFGTRWAYYDESRKSRAFPVGTPFTITDVVHNKTKLTFKKQFEGAPFVVFYTLTADKNEIRWDVECELHKGEEARSIKVEFSLPTLTDPMERHPDYRPPWILWAPVSEAPFPFSGIGGWGHSTSSWDIQRFPYSGANSGNGIAVPVIDIYSEKHDAGLAFAAPFELHKPELNFEVDKSYSEVRIIYTNLGLRPTNRPKASLMLNAHQGDWRPALGWLFNKYTEYFTPGDDKIIDQEGPMTYEYPILTEEIIKKWKEDMHFHWTEVLFNPSFENLVPQEDEWVFDMPKTEHKPDKWFKFTKQEVRDYFTLLKKHNVASFVYFNACECLKAVAEKEFPESLMEMDNGKWRSAWIWPDGIRENYNMNPDPDTKWGKHILRQTEDFFQAYPDLNGVFFDQLCYRTFDFSRDDGRTMLNNRPCFDTHTIYPEMVKKVVEILRKYKKTAFTNGPYNIEVQKGLDGIMSEGSVEGIAKYSYICLAKPIMILTSNFSLTKFEHTLKVCLKYGAFPAVRDHQTEAPRVNISEPEKLLYSRYLPLLEELRGRKWVFHPHAIKFPDGYDGNIFKNRKGHYVVTFYPKESVFIDRCNKAGARRIELNLPNIKNIDEAIWLSVETQEKRKLPVKSSGGGCYTLEVKEYTDASIFILESENK